MYRGWQFQSVPRKKHAAGMSFARIALGCHTQHIWNLQKEGYIVTRSLMAGLFRFYAPLRDPSIEYFGIARVIWNLIT